MPSIDPTDAPTPARIRELAQKQAVHLHYRATHLGVDRDGHNYLASSDLGCSICPHPDCVLVRADAAASLPRKCVIGAYCQSHGFVHGAEAEELRSRVEKILDEVDHEVDVADAANELDRRLRVMLDDVDARDSAAFASTPAINIEGTDGGPLPAEKIPTWLNLSTVLWERVPCEVAAASRAPSVAESCECPAKPGEPCPLSEAVCAASCRSALATPYLEQAAKSSGCAWKCYQNPAAIGAYCSRCENIALAMVDAVVKARGEWLTAASSVRQAETPSDNDVVDFLVAYYHYPDRATALRNAPERIFDDAKLIQSWATLKGLAAGARAVPPGRGFCCIGHVAIDWNLADGDCPLCHQKALVAGLMESACAVPETQEAWMRSLMCEAHKDYVIAPFDCPGCTHEAIAAEYDTAEALDAAIAPCPAVPVQDALPVDFTSIADGIVRNHETFCKGHSEPDAPYCSTLLPTDPMCDSCSRLRLHIAQAIRRAVIEDRRSGPPVQDAPSQIDETPAWWARCKKDGHQVGIADLRPYAWGFSCVDCEASEQVKVGAHKRPAVQDALTTQLEDVRVWIQKQADECRDTAERIERRIGQGRELDDHDAGIAAHYRKNQLFFQSKATAVEAALRRKAGEGQ